MKTNRLRRWIFPLLVPVMIVFALSQVSGVGHGVATQDANIDVHDKASLQNGAKYYMNYCMGCHSLKFSRYNRMAEDMGLNEDSGFTADEVKALLVENMIFTTDEDGKPEKVGALMKNAYSTKAASEAFGTAVPDLSLVGRSRNPDWIYSYLKGFYTDPSRPMGVNNTIFKDVGMPNVLWELQGTQELDTSHDASEADAHGGHDTGPKLIITKAGTKSEAEFDTIARDITNFLAYVSEPAQLSRYTIGIFVLLFLLVLWGFSYLLSREYWKDIH
ncbi:MAG: cytochrome c1 [Cocleimonas sp.]